MKMTPEARKRRIKEIISVNYELRSDLAADFLSAVEGADLDEQKELFALFLGVRGACRKTESRGKCKNSMNDKEWESICNRLIDEVRPLINSVLRNNASLEETASRLWDRVTLYEGRDRVVFLAMLVASSLMPYAQLPLNLTETRPLEVYSEAHDQIIEELTLLNRLLGPRDISNLEVALGAAKILDRIGGLEGRTAFLLEFIEKIKGCGLESCPIKKITKSIFGLD